MKEKKSNLDERQEQALLKIEHNGCWLAFWGLLITMAVQLLFEGFDMKLIVGEWIVFLTLCVYMGWACMKEGIWDRRLKPEPMTNFLLSLAAAVIMGLLMFFRVWKSFPDKPLGSAAAGLFIGGVIFVVCFAALSISAKQYEKRRQELDREEEEKEETKEKEESEN